jgi:serine/threonine-protein phosphatase 2A regulatory subunit A
MSADRPLEFLKEEMESDQLAVRVNAVHRSLVVAALIGPTAVEKDLVPYLECKPK